MIDLQAVYQKHKNYCVEKASNEYCEKFEAMMRADIESKNLCKVYKLQNIKIS